MRGLSLEGLAGMVEPPVSKQAISKYERGLMMPSSTVLLGMSRALGVPVDHLSQMRLVAMEKVGFRKKARLPKKRLAAIEGQVVAYLEKYLELEHLLGMNASFDSPVSSGVVRDAEDAERTAHELREAWELGPVAPLAGVVDLLEHKDVKVFELEAGDGFDGLSGWCGQIPVVVVARQALSVRKRFTALHELGHLLLRMDGSQSPRRSEGICHRFAGAVLLPSQALIREVGSRRTGLSLYELRKIEESFGISVQAVVRRARDLDIISEHCYRTFFINLSISGLKSADLGNFRGIEKADGADGLVHRALAEDLLSTDRAAYLSGKCPKQLYEEASGSE